MFLLSHFYYLKLWAHTYEKQIIVKSINFIFYLEKMHEYFIKYLQYIHDPLIKACSTRYSPNFTIISINTVEKKY